MSYKTDTKSQLHGVILNPEKLRGDSILNDSLLLDLGQKTWSKFLPSSGSAVFSNGVSSSRFLISGSGILVKGSFSIILKNTVFVNSDGVNNVTLAKGNASSLIKSIRVVLNGVTVSEIQDFGVLSVKKLKFENSSDHLSADQSIIGHFPSANTDLTGKTYDFTCIMPEDHFLNQSIPLRNLPDGSFLIEVDFNNQTDEYLSTTAGVGNLSFSCQPEIRFQMDNSVLNNEILGKTFHIPYKSYIHSRTSVPQNATIASVKLTSFQDGRLNAYESYLIHDADVSAKTLHTKLWNDQKNNLSSVSVKHNNKTIFIDSSIDTDPGFYRSHYDLRGWRDSSVSNWLTTNNKVDGDFSVSFLLTGISSVGGLKSGDMNVIYTFNPGASEALTIYAWYKVSHIINIDPDGRVYFTNV